MAETLQHTENKIQADMVSWFTNTYCLAFHNPRSLILSIPNGGERNEITAVISKAKGEYTGASDLLVIHLGVALFVEVKTPDLKKSVQKPAQILFQKHVEQAGYKYHLVRSLLEFQVLIHTISNGIATK